MGAVAAVYWVIWKQLQPWSLKQWVAWDVWSSYLCVALCLITALLLCCCQSSFVNNKAECCIQQSPSSLQAPGWTPLYRMLGPDGRPTCPGLWSFVTQGCSFPSV